MIGRPSKLTEKLQEKICGYIENGNPYNRACKLCGISNSIFCEWRDLGEKAKKEGISNQYSEFLETTEKASEKFIAFHISVINKAGSKGDWRASMELLARKYPREFAKKDYMALRAMNEEEIYLTFADIVRKETTDKKSE